MSRRTTRPQISAPTNAKMVVEQNRWVTSKESLHNHRIFFAEIACPATQQTRKTSGESRKDILIDNRRERVPIFSNMFLARKCTRRVIERGVVWILTGLLYFERMQYNPRQLSLSNSSIVGTGAARRSKSRVNLRSRHVPWLNQLQLQLHEHLYHLSILRMS